MLYKLACCFVHFSSKLQIISDAALRPDDQMMPGGGMGGMAGGAPGGGMGGMPAAHPAAASASSPHRQSKITQKGSTRMNRMEPLALSTGC